jgi:hypothetical protein
MSNASNLSTLANVLDDGTSGQFLKSTGSGGVEFDTVAAGAVVYATADLLPLSGFAAGDMAYVTATNRFYINNGSGWYSISLVNTNPNITSVADASSGTTPFTLATDGTATVITITAADPEEVPLTYGYSVTSGSLNGSTVAQGTGSNTNVFTVTPHASQDATFTLTFTASDGINQATSANAFSLSFVTIVTDSNHTTLLATATGTSDNNNITDSSSNSHSITVTGDAYAGTFSPYRSGGYSTYFDGNGDYLEVPQSSNSSSFGTGEFTVEFWFKPSEAGSTVFFIDFRGSANSGFQIFRRSTNFIRVRGLNQTTLIDGTTSISDFNTWYHICVHRNSSNELKLFINGAQDGGTVTGHTTNYAHPTSGNWLIGKQYNSTDYPNGYMRDVRIVKGTAITPPSGGPTERLEAVTNTTLLTCHLPYIADGSTNDHSITVSGNTSPKPFSPYDYNEYDAADHGGSILFDGSSNLEAATSADFAFGTGDFTIEAWVYKTDSGSWRILLDQSYSSSGISIWTDTANKLKYYSGSALKLTSTTEVPQDAWTHISLVRASASTKFYINGQSASSAWGDTIDYSTNRPFKIASDNNTASYGYNGYISDVRVVKGTAIYTSNFTPNSAPLSAVTNTSLLVKGTDASIIDKSQGSNLQLEGNTTGSATTKFTGAKSMYFDGSSDYLVVPASSEINFGTSDFTVEFWINFAAFPSNGYILNKEDSSGNDFTLQYYQNAIKTSNATIGSGWTHYSSGIGSLSTGTWYHIAYSRSSGTLKSFKDGTQINSATDSRNYNLNNAITLGSRYPGDYAANIYVQDLRITKGLARYTASDETSNIPSAPLEG